ncbi:MAG: DNA repair protein RadA [Gammaproteobacteria bacterium]|nr:DNA repair protein RadA [Gammaproteobacteria bacterium]
MAKAKSQFQCTECGAVFSKWNGQCSDCEAWNTLTEVVAVNSPPASDRFTNYAGASGILNASEVSLSEQTRLPTGLSELDRVLGGGLVPGSVTLLGGDPGIGKSTVLLQCLAYLAESKRTLYITGEESLQQVAMRGHRLELPIERLRLLAETRIEGILAHADQEKPEIMVIDSIQTMFTDSLTSAPGAVAQVREASARLVRYAKQTGTSVFLVGHVTKEGALAGPRVLEHMVDTVLYFEGDPGSRFRVIRAVKNRFGAVNELGVFAMSETGLKVVTNPSAIFLSRHPEPVSGSVIMVTREGTRPMLVEAQALVDGSHLGNPRRVALGLEQNRLAMLLAVLHRHAGIAMFDQDVYVNVVGGVRISETAADLAVVLAALSSFRNRPLPPELVVFGEIGLAGEVRPVANGEERLQESIKHGFKRAIVAEANKPKKPIKGLQVDGIHRLHEAIDLID